MTVTEDRTTARVEQPRDAHAAIAGAGRPPPPHEQPELAAPGAWSDPDLRSMRWAVLVSFLLGAYAAAFVLFGASLTP